MVNSLKQPFPRDALLRQKSLEEGRPIHEIDAEWREASQKGIELGNNVHGYIHAVLTGQKIDRIGYVEEKAFDYFFENHKSKVAFLVSELSIGDKELRIGGTTDCIVYDFTAKKYRVIDWKTGKFDRHGWDKKLKDPLSHLDDSELVKYSLQVRIYDLILRRNVPEFSTVPPCIVHLNKHGEYEIVNAIMISDDEITDWLK